MERNLRFTYKIHELAKEFLHILKVFRLSFITDFITRRLRVPFRKRRTILLVYGTS